MNMVQSSLNDYNTQLDSFLALQKSNKVNMQENIILTVLEANPLGLSRQDIVKLTEGSIPLASVSRAINGLMWKGKVAIIARKKGVNQQIVGHGKFYPGYIGLTLDFLKEQREKKVNRLVYNI